MLRFPTPPPRQKFRRECEGRANVFLLDPIVLTYPLDRVASGEGADEHIEWNPCPLNHRPTILNRGIYVDSLLPVVIHGCLIIAQPFRSLPSDAVDGLQRALILSLAGKEVMRMDHQRCRLEIRPSAY
jgi:hypothetical protein